MIRFATLAMMVTLSPFAVAAPPAFDREIAPLLSEHCLSCHSGPKPRGDLDLTRKATVLTQDVVTPGSLAKSPLWTRVHDDEMPPKKPLKAEEKTLLKEWIEAGAPWGTDPIDPLKYSTRNRAGLDWWSLQPLKSTTPPKAATHPIDAFLAAKRTEFKLPTSPLADRRTLIRRLSLDLIGLLPTPEEVNRFVEDDNPGAYSRLVDRLLASPHYGERWARHWLDVVRFGESQGFERNDPRLTAWHYRDWVIRALNADLPYDQFTRLQIAGDVLLPGDADAIKATGYLVAGIHNTVLPAQQAARQTARQDELEDIVGNLGQTFLGLSVHCARCHDHKFDPISQTDYYRITAAVSGVTHGERTVDQPEYRQQAEQLRQKLDQLQEELTQLETPVRERLLAERGVKADRPAGPTPLLSWDFQEPNPAEKLQLLGGAKLTPEGLKLNGTRAFARSEPLRQSVREKSLEAWVKLDNLQQRGGGVMTLQSPDGNVFDAIVIGEQQAKHWMAGSNFFARTKPFQGPEEKSLDPVHLVITYEKSGLITAYRDGQLYGKSYRSDGPVTFEAGKAIVAFGVRHEPAGGNKMLAGTILRARLYDKALSAEEVIRSGRHTHLITEAELLAAMPDAQRKQRQELQQKRVEQQAELSRLESATVVKVFATVPTQPPVTRLLVRGQVTDPAEPIRPSGISCLTSASFELPETSPEAERRKQLAQWITAAANPLFPRVMVNRVWQHHFGIGLVDSPNDFGFNGGKPSHPELLDWLAIRFRDDGYSLKKLHRLIVTSQAYQQSSTMNTEAFAIDAESRYLWRKRPQRLDAESLRDAMLTVSGLLNREVGGQGFNDYRLNSNAGTMYYEPFDPVGPLFHRRSIYRFLPRSANPGLLDAFDCPDPAGSVPRRASTTTPLQALSLWNSDFALRMSSTLAERLNQKTLERADRVKLAYQLCYQRDPTEEELQRAVMLVRQHGERALTRALLNSNEFLTIE